MSNLTTLEKVPFETLFSETVNELMRGALLVCGEHDTRLNPMTIGWCMFGTVWNRPMALVLVRHSRYSHKLMEETPVFGISVPAHDAMNDVLEYCGRVSGRDEDKLLKLGLRPLPLQGGAYGVEGCKNHFACRTVFKAESDLKLLDDTLLRRFYKDFDGTTGGDPHTLYFGEILSAWTAE